MAKAKAKTTAAADADSTQSNATAVPGQTVTINGKAYALASLSPQARTLMRNIELTDARLRDLKQQVAMIQVARDAYGQALVSVLPTDPQKLS